MGELLAFPPVGRASGLSEPQQSGQPALLLAFPDGRVHLRTTAAGFRALEQLFNLEPDIPLLPTYGRLPGGPPILAEGLLPTEELGDPLALKLALDPWLVVHTYRSIHSLEDPTYSHHFRRVGASPDSSPSQRYLWCVDFGVHGDGWLFGTPRDLAIGEELLKNHSLVTLEERVGRGMGQEEELEAAVVPSRRIAVATHHLRQRGYWIREESVWCTCH